MRAVVDNDILLKGACYGLLTEFVATIPGTSRLGILGASKFVVPSQIKKVNLRGDLSSVLARFSSFVASNELLESSLEEQNMAAVFEANAQQLALNLDAGESQLAAIAISRSLDWLLTGDKRAIGAIESLIDTDARLSVLTGKIKCLEHIARKLVDSGDAQVTRDTICGEPDVDKALTICFGCYSATADTTTILTGLASYISDLRKSAPRVLAT